MEAPSATAIEIGKPLDDQTLLSQLNESQKETNKLLQRTFNFMNLYLFLITMLLVMLSITVIRKL